MSRAMLAVGGTVLALSSSVSGQISVDYPPIPTPLSRAVKETQIVLLAELESMDNASYVQKLSTGVVPIPVTVFTVRILELMKGAPLVERTARLQFRKPGFTVDDRANATTRKEADLALRPLTLRREYVFFLLRNQVGEYWLEYGAQGVFENRAGLAWTCHPMSPLAAAWDGKPWTDLLDAIRQDSHGV